MNFSIESLDDFSNPAAAPYFIPCTEKQLPAGMQEAASLEAIAQNPANRPAIEAMAAVGLILPPEHIAVLTTKYWGNKGVKLAVGFMESCPADLAARILLHFNAWGEFANVAFALTQTDPQVRITRNQDGYWSYLGTDVLSIPRGQATMCLQGFTMNTPESEFRRVIRHEVGHTLGFPHEHMRREIVERIDPLKAIAYFRQTQGWSASMVQQQVLTPLSESSIMGSPNADQTSIMCYSLPGSITRDGMPIVGGKDFTADDRAFVAKLYPKEIVAPPPKPPEPPAPPVEPAAGDIVLQLNLATKQMSVQFPTGWTVVKKSSTTQEGAIMACDKVQMAALAAELEAALPTGDALVAARQSAPLGGTIGKILDLIAALKAGDLTVVANAFYELLGLLLGKATPATGGGGEISFGQQAGVFSGFDWKKLVAILQKLLPLLLEAA